MGPSVDSPTPQLHTKQDTFNIFTGVLSEQQAFNAFASWDPDSRSSAIVSPPPWCGAKGLRLINQFAILKSDSEGGIPFLHDVRLQALSVISHGRVRDLCWTDPYLASYSGCFVLKQLSRAPRNALRIADELLYEALSAEGGTGQAREFFAAWSLQQLALLPSNAKVMAEHGTLLDSLGAMALSFHELTAHGAIAALQFIVEGCSQVLPIAERCTVLHALCQVVQKQGPSEVRLAAAKALGVLQRGCVLARRMELAQTIHQALHGAVDSGDVGVEAAIAATWQLVSDRQAAPLSSRLGVLEILMAALEHSFEELPRRGEVVTTAVDAFRMLCQCRNFHPKITEQDWIHSRLKAEYEMQSMLLSRGDKTNAALVKMLQILLPKFVPADVAHNRS